MFKKMKYFSIVLVSFLMGPLAMSQETQPAVEGSDDSLAGFQWLEQFEGEWQTQFGGVMTSRLVGTKWLVNDIQFPTGLFSIQTLGYDEKEEQYIGTWVDASSSFIWRYSGALDDLGKTIELYAEGPSMTEGSKMLRYRDTYRFISKDEIEATSSMMGENGDWKVFNRSKIVRNTD